MAGVVPDRFWPPFYGICCTASRLLVCTGSSKVYLWSQEGASCVHVPITGFHARAASWNADGRSFALRDVGAFTMAFLE